MRRQSNTQSIIGLSGLRGWKLPRMTLPSGKCFVNVVQKLDHKLIAEIVDQSDAVDQILVAKIDSFFFRYEINEVGVDQSHLLLQSGLISPLSHKRQRLKVDVNQRRR